MATKIPWTNETWNFQGGCTPESTGCLHCAAARSAEECTKHWGNKKYEGLTLNGKWTGELRFFPEELKKPLHWKKPRMVFPAFMSDLFHPDVPFEWIDKVMAVIALSSQHTFQVLTKRPERMKAYFESENSIRADAIFGAIEKYTGGHLASAGMVEEWCKKHNVSVKKRYELNHKENLLINRIYPDKPMFPLPNLWHGVTAENQTWMDNRVTELIFNIRSVKKFISFEPLLGPIFERKYLQDIDWVIVGCESGPKRRPCKLEWIESIVSQCKAADIPVFVKQVEINGKVEHDMNKFPESIRFQEFPKTNP